MVDEVCSRCMQSFMDCHCENFHPPVRVPHQDGIYLDYDELKALYTWLEHQFIHPEYERMNAVVTRIQQHLRKQQ